jgi:dynein heavy chain
MSPAGDSLRIRSRKFPSLINCCSIDWFNSWSEEALMNVANKFIVNMNIESQSHK